MGNRFLVANGWFGWDFEIRINFVEKGLKYELNLLPLCPLNKL
jgi:hypothetical protein